MREKWIRFDQKGRILDIKGVWTFEELRKVLTK